MFKPTITAELSKTIDVPEAEATITIRYVKPGVMKDISDESMKVTALEKDDGSGNLLQHIAINTSVKSRGVVRACMKGWTGFSGKSGGELKFSAGSLEDMIRESTEFVDFVYDEHSKFVEEVEGEQEAAAKNS